MKDKPEKATVLELKVSMHCKACERSVFNSLRKIKGVEAISTDMNTHKAIIKGQIEPQKILKRLKKKTGKRAEIVMNSNDSDNAKGDDNTEASGSCGCNELDNSLLMHSDLDEKLVLSFDMFSDENPNACSVM